MHHRVILSARLSSLLGVYSLSVSNIQVIHNIGSRVYDQVGVGVLARGWRISLGNTVRNRAAESRI